MSEHGPSVIDLRDDYDEIAYVKDGTLYRRREIIQAWWDKLGRETWSCPNNEQAIENFNAMKERWSSSGNPAPTGTCYEETAPQVTMEALSPLYPYKNREDIWISGSHATGTATVMSDIDIVVGLPSFPEAAARIELERQVEFAKRMESDLVSKTEKAEVYFVDEGGSVWRLGPLKIGLEGAPSELWRKARPISEFFRTTTPQGAKGTCYEDAWRYLIKQGEGYLVHGSVQLTKEGARVKHAWVELPTGFIWEPQTGQHFTIEDFKIMSPIEEQQYTATEAAIMVARVGKHGPWTDEERMEHIGR